jgi:hypothetical protein
MEYTQNYHDILFVLGVMGFLIGYLAGKGKLFKGWQ